MRLKLLGAASIAAIAIVACAKKDETKAVDAVVAADEVVADEATSEATDAAVAATDVYAAPASIDLASVRTKDALTAAADAAFVQADADADGSLSQTEFHALASILAPAAGETVVDTAVDAAADVAGAIVGDVALEPAAEAAVDAVAAEAAVADAATLDESFASIAGADSSLTTDDLRSAFLSRFDAADANLDGALDDAEAEAFKAAKLF